MIHEIQIAFNCEGFYRGCMGSKNEKYVFYFLDKTSELYAGMEMGELERSRKGWESKLLHDCDIWWFHLKK